MQETTPQPNPHEHLLAALSNIVLEINALQAVAQDETPDLGVLRGGLALIEQAARSAIQEIRAASDDAVLPELVGVTLTEALTRLVDETSESLGLSSRVTISGDERPLPPMTERVLYRLVQESLYQVQQRGSARKLRFTFHYGRDEVRVGIEDDGSADEMMVETPIPHFAFADATDRRGSDERDRNDGRNELRPYATLRHRLEHVGGTLEITVLADGGTRVQARAPYVVPMLDDTERACRRARRMLFPCWMTRWRRASPARSPREQMRLPRCAYSSSMGRLCRAPVCAACWKAMPVCRWWARRRTACRPSARRWNLARRLC